VECRLGNGRGGFDPDLREARDQRDRLVEWADALVTGSLPPPQQEAQGTVDISEWREAEELAAFALQKMGWPDAVTTGAGSDAGLDVVGRYVAAQVKYQSALVGRPVIQRLVGAGRGRELACFARNGYSQQATDFADEEEIALFTISLPGTVSTANDVARRWFQTWEE